MFFDEKTLINFSYAIFFLDENKFQDVTTAFVRFFFDNKFKHAKPTYYDKLLVNAPLDSFSKMTSL